MHKKSGDRAVVLIQIRAAIQQQQGLPQAQQRSRQRDPDSDAKQASSVSDTYGPAMREAVEKTSINQSQRKTSYAEKSLMDHAAQDP